MSHSSKYLITAIVTVIIIGALSITAFLHKNNQGLPAMGILPTAAPTSFPYQELTIPYLRNRAYPGKLSGTSEPVQNNAAYTGYLTNYSSDGLKINGLLTIPTGKAPEGGWPAIVFVHGYIPPKQYTTLAKYVDYVDYLARNGFVVFKIDLRGHGDSEGTPSGAYYSSSYVIDTLNAYNALQQSGYVNPKKVGLWGHSMAGNIVLRSVAVKPEIPAAVIWAGAGYSYTDLVKYKIHDTSFVPLPSTTAAPGSRQKLMEAVGEVTNTSPFWKQVAATNYINDMKGAIAVHQAVDDDVVNIGYSRDLKPLFDASTVPHEFYEYPSGGHNISGPSFDTAMERTVAFYKKYLAE